MKVRGIFYPFFPKQKLSTGGSCLINKTEWKCSEKKCWKHSEDWDVVLKILQMHLNFELSMSGWSTTHLYLCPVTKSNFRSLETVLARIILKGRNAAARNRWAPVRTPGCVFQGFYCFYLSLFPAEMVREVPSHLFPSAKISHLDLKITKELDLSLLRFVQPQLRDHHHVLALCGSDCDKLMNLVSWKHLRFVMQGNRKS